MLYKRRAVTANAAGSIAGVDLAERVVAHLGAGAAGQTVSAFLPIRTEIDTRPLIAQLVESGALVALPTIIGDSPDLVFRQWAPGDSVAKGAFGVEEPLSSSPARDPAILVIPLLAFDRAGYRLGYGGGYYDRAIARLRTLHPIRTIGVAFDGQEVVHVPREGHDEQLDAIVTPSRVLQFESR